MKILSIDVGVKNLAICLFNIIDKNKFKILIWDVVDLEQNKTYTCNCICNKTKKTCTNKATYEMNNLYYCKTHSKKTEFIVPTKELNKNKIKKLKLNELLMLCDKYNILNEDQKQCKILKTGLLDIVNTYIDKHVFHLVSSNTDKQSDLVTLGKNLKLLFNTIFDMHTIDMVLIENQISPLANKMKTLQGMIAQYFIMKDVNNIKFVSSINKLKHFENNESKTTYSERKKYSIEKCNEILINNPNIIDNIDIFNKSKKKDDLADSFLQGLVYLIDFKIINFVL